MHGVLDELAPLVSAVIVVALHLLFCIDLHIATIVPCCRSIALGIPHNVTILYKHVLYGNLHECRIHLHIMESSLCRLVLVHWMNGILYVIMGSTGDLIH